MCISCTHSFWHCLIAFVNYFGRVSEHDSYGNYLFQPGGSPYHTIHQVDMSLEGWNYPMLKQNRSNSWSDSLDDFKFTSTIVEHTEINDTDSEKSVK